MKIKTVFILTILMVCSCVFYAQNILPTPFKATALYSTFVFSKNITIAYESDCMESAQYLKKRLENYIQVRLVESQNGDIVLSLDVDNPSIGGEGYSLKIMENKIKISANNNAGVFYGIQSLLQLLPNQVQAKKEPFKLKKTALKGFEIIDYPKYKWRSFMLDSGRQYQSPEFIKAYLDHMAMLKMNVFHWHLTEGMGWRIEIKRYPKLTEIGSNVASGKEQQGFYSQEQIKDIVAYAKTLNIIVVPEIDVPGHSEAALTAHPEMSCFKKAPESVMTFSSNLFCAGREETYLFLENILDEVCELFTSNYIHLGGDEAPKQNWNACLDCQNKIQEEKLHDSHDLQLYFSSRLAKYLKKKGKKVIFWGDVVHNEGTALPNNVIIQWWNYRKHSDLALKNAIKRGHQVICNTNNYSYLNFPVSPWSKYKKNRSFDLKMTYEQNPSDLENPHELVIGMGSSLWTDWGVQEHMIDQRVFPRIFSLSEQMWYAGEKLPFDAFYEKVQQKYSLFKLMDVTYGPALKNEVPLEYQWD